MASNEKHPKNRRFSILALLRGSLILTVLDRFTEFVYRLLKNGLFGTIFCGYRNHSASRLVNRLRQSKSALLWNELRFGLCRRIESSLLLHGFSTFTRFLLGCRLKVYGAFLLSFGVYSALISIAKSLLSSGLLSLLEDPDAMVSLVTVAASVPLILSSKNLSEALITSRIGKLIAGGTGFTEEDMNRTCGDGGRMNTAFILGIIFGILTYSISTVLILGGCVGGLWLYLVLMRPEIGVVTMFFAMPLLPTMALAAIVIYTTLCYLIKLFRNKRLLRLEPVDIMAMAFMALVFSGGVISVSPASLKPALLMVCLMMGYFLTTQLIASREWIVRCSVAAVSSATLVSLYGIFMYFTGGGYSSDAWLDEEMFGEIAGRAVATLENPNVLGEYLILILPIAVSMLIGRGEGLRRVSALFCIGVMGVCLLLTWSRGAWLGLIFAAVLFLFLWHRRSLWLVIGGIACLPLAVTFLPSSIVSRFTSIGNMADSSTSYRVYIWRASVNMIEDHLLSGIGIGEGAWRRLYPLYSYLGVEAAPHSHNLYLQIWLEIGVFGLLVFLGFLFLLYQSGFTLFGRLSGNSTLRTPDISERALRNDLLTQESPKQQMARSKTQLRISTAGPLCGIFAVLVQGLTDYAWYNYRMFLMFWLVTALASSYIRSGNSLLEKHDFGHDGDSTSWDATIRVTSEK